MYTATLPATLPRVVAGMSTPPTGPSPFASLRGAGNSPEEAFAGLLVAIYVRTQTAGDDRLPTEELLVDFAGPGLAARRDMHQLRRIAMDFAAEMDYLRQEWERHAPGMDVARATLTETAP